MNRSIYYFISLFFLSLSSSCYYDVEDEIYPLNKVLPGDSVSYSLHVEPIINNNCYACHDINNLSGDGIELEGFDNLKSYLDGNTESFLCSINHTSCGRAMPIGASKLSDRDIGIIERWIEEGALDN